MRNAMHLRATYRPSDDLEREAQLVEKNNRRLAAFYQRRPSTTVPRQHRHLVYRPPGNNQPTA